MEKPVLLTRENPQRGAEREYTQDAGVLLRNNDIMGGVIFEGRNGREVISRAYICAAMKELGTKVGIPREKLFAHNLRHLFAKRFIEKTNDIVTLPTCWVIPA